MSLQLAITVIALAEMAPIGLATLVMSRAKLLTPCGSAAGDETDKQLYLSHNTRSQATARRSGQRIKVST
jgi:hypothetical protein